MIENNRNMFCFSNSFPIHLYHNNNSNNNNVFTTCTKVEIKFVNELLSTGNRFENYNSIQKEIILTNQ